MKAEAMFISRFDDDEDPSEIMGGRVAKPHAFPWYLLIPLLKKNFLSVLRQFPTNYLTLIGLTEALFVMIHQIQTRIFFILKQPYITVSQTLVLHFIHFSYE